MMSRILLITLIPAVHAFRPTHSFLPLSGIPFTLKEVYNLSYDWLTRVYLLQAGHVIF